MTREHTPRPGTTWGREPARVERPVEDDAPVEPAPPANRAERRAAARALRRKGGSR